MTAAARTSTSTRAARRSPRRGTIAATTLPCTVRRPDGTVFEGELPAERHQRIQIGMLHRDSAGLIEVGHGYRPPGGKTRWASRRRDDVYHPGGAAGGADWLDRVIAHVAQLTSRPRVEVAIVPSVRSEPRAQKDAVSYSRYLWVDVDDPAVLPRLHAFLAEHPAHLRVESAGSGGEHAYWRLSRPLPAVIPDPHSGERYEWIERANKRLIHHLGGADRACADRSRLMRLAGTTNYKRGLSARVISADFALPGYSLRTLVGALPDMPGTPPTTAQVHVPMGGDRDPYKRIPAVDYFHRMTGQEPDAGGFVRCPMPDHEDRNPSCSVRGPNAYTWKCHVCDVGGTIYDLASALLGGPVGRGALRDAAFIAAREHVVACFGPR